MRRGELVALVDAAPGGLRTLAGTLRHRMHHGRMDEARRRAEAVRRARSEISIVLAVVHAGGADPPEWSEHVSRVWFAAPNRWRITGNDALGSLDISDGRQRWQGLEGYVTERGRDPELGGAGHLGRLLAPGWLLGALTFGDVAEEELGGRRCVVAAGRPRGAADQGRGLLSTVAAGFTSEALEHRFWFDATHGFLVRSEGLVDGEPAVVDELTDVVADGPVEPERFWVPEGTTIQTEAEERARRHERPVLATGAAGHAGADLEERVRQHVAWGPTPDDEAAAGAAVRAAFAELAETGPDGRDLVNVQAGHGLGPLLARARRHVPGATDAMTTTVDAVRFLGPDQAAVWFSIDVAGDRLPLVHQRPGRAVRAGGRWLVEHATVAELLALAGVRVPPPDQRPGTGGAGPAPSPPS